MRQHSSLLRHRRTGSLSTSTSWPWRPRLEELETRLAPSIITVTSTADSGPGSLRAALATANSDFNAGDEIVFNLPKPSTIQLTSGSLNISSTVTIAGPGPSSLTVKGNGTFGIFNITSDATDLSGVTITGMTITAGGGNSGGGISCTSNFFFLTPLVLNNCIVTGNSAGSKGGGIFCAGSLTMNHCVVSNNTASGDGGGISYSQDPATIPGLGQAIVSDSTVTGNRAGNINAPESLGGGIENDGPMVITDSVIQNNVAEASAGNSQGGGIFDDGTLSIFDSSIIGNSATGALTDLFVSQGGGIYDQSSLIMNGCTIAGNTAAGGKAFIGTGGIGSPGQGGGLYLNGTSTLTDCTITANLAEGGTSNISAGGGIFTGLGATIQLLSCTIAKNSATGPSGSAVGGTGGGLFDVSPISMANTIVAANSAGLGPDVDASITASGCLIGDDDSLTLGVNSTADQLGFAGGPINLDLGPLANYGGPTQTMALLPGSPGIDKGDNAFVTERYDQRGYARVANGTVDIGAYEFQPEHLIAVGAGYGMAPEVKVYDAASGQLKLDFLAYESTFTGGVRVAVADVNGDGIPDIITVPGGVKVTLVDVNGALVPSFDLSAGRAPEVKVFSGVDGSLLDDFLAYDASFKAGMFVAAADISGNSGHADIIVSPDATGQSGHTNVRVFFNNRLIKTGASLSPDREFNAYASGFGGGVRIAAGDINGDGHPDIITAPGIWSGPDVRIFDGQAITANNPPHMIGEFLAYAAGYFGGVFVASGDVNGDGRADVITGTNGNGGPEVKAFDGLSIGVGTPPPRVLDDFFAYNPAFNGGSTVAALDVNGDGVADIITGAGPGGGPHVRIFDGSTGQQLQENTTDSFMAFDPSFSGGVFVGGA
jgi:FG-GAP repeat